MKRKIITFILLIIASFSLYAGVVYYGSGRAVFLENILQFANFFEIEATGIKNLRLGGEVKAHNVQAANVDKNFIPFGSFETSDEDFTSYVDAAAVLPVDGTGGGASSFLTCAQSATTPLEGSGSLNMVKFNIASGGQGHGCSYDFTVSTAGQAQGMTLSFDYKWTDVAANEDNDFIVYLYDVDKSQLIAPVPYEIKKSAYVTKFISGFMTDATSTNYRLIFHLAQSRAGIFSLKVDNLFVGKSTYARGSPITDWKSFTPVISAIIGTTPAALSPSGKWRRVGSHMEIKFFLKWTGAPAAAFTALVSQIPSGYSIDYTALGQEQATAVGERNGGTGSYLDVGGQEYQIVTRVDPVGGTVSFRPSIQVTGDLIASGNISETYPFSPVSGDYLNASISVPIAGWSSNVVMSETMPGRDVVLVLEGNGSGQSLPNDTVTKVTNWAVVKNPANIWNASTSEVTIPESGYYSISFSWRSTGGTGSDVSRATALLYKNGVISKLGQQGTNATGISYAPSLSLSSAYFTKGDVLYGGAYIANTDAETLTIDGTPSAQSFSLAKLNTGNQTIGLEETVLQKVSAVSNPNLLINGGFDLWQRGTSQTTSGYGSDDRWDNRNTGTTKTHSRQDSTDTERALFSSPYYSRTVVSSVTGASNNCHKFQRIEDVTRLAGKTVTLSFWAKADANKNMSIEFAQIFGTGGSSTVDLIGIQKIPLTTTWQRKAVTVSIPSTVGKTIVSGNIHTSYTVLIFWLDAGTDLNYRTVSLGQQSGTFDIAEVKLEIGSVATPFSLAGGNIAGELAMAQRYYEKSFVTVATELPGLIWINGQSDQTLAPGPTFQTSKRVNPHTVQIYAGNGDGTLGSVNTGVGLRTVTSVVDIGIRGIGRVYFNTTGANAWVSYHFTADAEF
jgi:hypothetical protein